MVSLDKRSLKAINQFRKVINKTINKIFTAHILVHFMYSVSSNVYTTQDIKIISSGFFHAELMQVFCIFLFPALA